MRITFLFLLIVIIGANFLLAAPGLAQCANSHNDIHPPNSDRVRLIITPSVQPLSTGIRQGMSDWNNSPCVNRFLNPFPYAEFYVGSGGGLSISVQRRDEAGEGRAADLTILGSGNGIVRLYNRISIDGMVLTVDWSTEAVRDAIAHELGHFLGLADGPCFGHIMSSPFVSNVGGMAVLSTNREVKEAECNKADEMGTTDWEEDEETCQLDPDCNPDAPCGPFCCPIVVDFDAQGLNFSAGPVTFDIDANGEAERLTWIDGDGGDYFLAFDRNRNGIIDDGSELFGSGTPLRNGYLAPHGYAAMQELDDPAFGGNGDQFLSRHDAQFGNLYLWHDSNQNAVSESWEILKVERSGLIWIDLRFQSTDQIDAHGNELKFTSPALIHRGGRLIWTTAGDVFFRNLKQP